MTRAHPGTAVTKVDVVQGPDVTSQGDCLLQPAEAGGRWPVTDITPLSQTSHSCHRHHFVTIKAPNFSPPPVKSHSKIILMFAPWTTCCPHPPKWSPDPCLRNPVFCNKTSCIMGETRNGLTLQNIIYLSQVIIHEPTFQTIWFHSISKIHYWFNILHKQFAGVSNTAYYLCNNYKVCFHSVRQFYINNLFIYRTCLYTICCNW